MYHRYTSSSNQSSFRSFSPLTNDQILQHAPSVMAAEAHESRGERYAFIPTIEVLDGLRAEGFRPFEVRQTRCRDLGKREFTKHLVRLRHADAGSNDGEVPEIVLVNSHDGTSSYQLLSGIFKMICSNGLIAGDVCDDIRIRHSGRIVQDVIEGSYRVLDNMKLVSERVDEYRSTVLTQGEQSAFAEAAVELRWGSDTETGNSLAPIDNSRQVLVPRRYEDRKDDAFTVLNRAQENLIQGGLPGRSASGRRTRTREVAGVKENVRLNRGLWTLMDALVRHKNGEEILRAA